MTQLCKGLTVDKNANGFTVARLHYSADPEKDEAWAETYRKGYLTDIWNQEMELDFTKATGKRVFPEFNRELHVRDSLKAIDHVTIWRGWDFGYQFPACVWFQLTETDVVHVLAEHLGHDKVINEYAKEVKQISRMLFPGFDFKDAGDPACRARGDKSKRTSSDILRSMEIKIQTRPMQVIDGINLIRNLLLPRIDGTTKFLIDSTRCPLLVSGFMGEYLRDENDVPQKEGYLEHLFDGLRYGLTILFNPKTNERIRPAHSFVIKRTTTNQSTGY